MDLLRGSPPEQKLSFHSSEDYVRDLAKRLEVIHCGIRERIEEKSLKMKAWYDQKTRLIQFREVWLYNPRRVKEKAPKLQCNWEGSFSIVKKLGVVIFCIESHRNKKKRLSMQID